MFLSQTQRGKDREVGVVTVVIETFVSNACCLGRGEVIVTQVDFLSLSSMCVIFYSDAAYSGSRIC